MVEALILVEPLHGEVVVAEVLKCCVDRRQVLQTTLGGDKLVRWLEHILVIDTEASWKPSLLHLGVRVSGDLEVLVDAGEDGDGNLALVLNKSRVEDRLQV